MRKILFALAVLFLSGLPVWTQDKDMEETRNKLDSVKISINETDVPIGKLIDQIKKVGDLNIHFDPAVAADFGEGGARITLKLDNVTLKTALKLVLQKDDKYTVTYKNSVLLITTKEQAKQNMVTRVYDVRDLLLKIQDFAGPRVELTSSTGAGASGGGGGGLVGNVFSLDSSAGEKANLIDAKFLQDMVRQNTGKGEASWGDGSSLELKDGQGMLWVTNTKTMQKEVHRFIQILRQIKR